MNGVGEKDTKSGDEFNSSSSTGTGGMNMASHASG
jgi:hypothetical protein